MPRHARLELPNVPLHVIQRGVNRGAIFVDDGDRHHFLDLLQDAARDHDLAIHAYVLMGNHVHLLVTPPETGALSGAMRRLGQRVKGSQPINSWEGKGVARVKGSQPINSCASASGAQSTHRMESGVV